jgi:hypothetical protein
MIKLDFIYNENDFIGEDLFYLYRNFIIETIFGLDYVLYDENLQILSLFFRRATLCDVITFKPINCGHTIILIDENELNNAPFISCDKNFINIIQKIKNYADVTHVSFMIKLGEVDI